MIGISFLAGLALWGALAVWISKRIPHWAGIAKHTTVVSVLVFPFVFLAPVADELIGRWQFHQLCEREAVVWLSPDWETVRRAKDNDDPMYELDGFVFPIKVQYIELVDIDTKLPFVKIRAFHTKGGFLMRHGLGLDGITSCWPPDWIQVMNQVDSEKLLKQGKMK